jgi:hypothetical protein
MPGAVLRVSGSKASVTRFLEGSRWKPNIVFWKGKPKLEGSKRLSTINGFNHSVSEASGSRLDLQIRDAIKFLRREHAAIRSLGKLKLHVTLDFGVETNGGMPVTSYRFDVRLLSRLSEAGIELELSQYTVDASDDV